MVYTPFSNNNNLVLKKWALKKLYFGFGSGSTAGFFLDHHPRILRLSSLNYWNSNKAVADIIEVEYNQSMF